MPVVLCGDFNSLALKVHADEYDIVPRFPPGGARSGAYELVTTGTAPSRVCLLLLLLLLMLLLLLLLLLMLL